MNNAYESREPHTFAGVEPPSKPTIAILPVPYEGTASYGIGASRGPAAIIDASRHMELYDREFDRETADVGIVTLPALSPDYREPAATHRRIATAVRSVLDQSLWPLVLGGEHSITPPTLLAMKERFGEIGVIQFDAHADLRDEFEGTRDSHACAMRRCLDLGIPLVQLGIRSLSLEERDFLRTAPKNHAIRFDGPPKDDSFLAALPKRVFITFDVDVLDPSVMPATGTPEPDGWSFRQAVNVLRTIFRSRDVVGADLVEFAPIPGVPAPDFTVALLAYKLIGFRSFPNR